MTLSAEERDIAHRSIVDRPDMPPLSAAQKEYLYLKNRERYRSMLADGSLQRSRKTVRNVVPCFNCSDAAVRQFVVEQFLHIGPYAVADLVMTAKEIKAEARERFGNRAADLDFWIQ